MTETEKDDLKDIFMAKLQYNVRNDELIHIDYVDDAVNSLLQDLVKKLNIDDVSQQSENVKAFLLWLDMGDTADVIVKKYLKSL